MPESRRRSIVFPLLLIVAGVALLLEQFGVWDIPWGVAWRLWPLLLVLAGLDLVLGRSRTGAVILAALVIGLAAAGIVYWGPLLESGVPRDRAQLSHPLEGAQSATVQIELGVGELDLSALERSSQALYEADIRYDQRRGSITADVAPQTGDVRVLLKSTQGAWVMVAPHNLEAWTLLLSPRIPLRLDIAGGVNRSQLDLSGLWLTRLDFRGGVGEVRVVLSERAPYQARVNGGIGALTVEVPEGVEARLRVDGGLGAVNVSSRFQRQGYYYTTAGYRGDRDALEIVVNGGIGALTVR
jgi:hypothetical protein